MSNTKHADTAWPPPPTNDEGSVASGPPREHENEPKYCADLTPIKQAAIRAALARIGYRISVIDAGHGSTARFIVRGGYSPELHDLSALQRRVHPAFRAPKGAGGS